MIKGLKNTLIILMTVFLTLNVYSQDIHFTQFFSAPSTLNPGLTGFSNSRLRAFVNHRNQWASVSLPFQTYSATFDAQLLKRKRKGDMFGIGMSAFSDKAGDSQFGTQSMSFALNYVKALGDYSSRNLLGFGIQGSYVMRSLDYHSLYFDSQYNGVQFDPNLNTGELFSIDNYQYYDVAAGINWFSNINYDITLQTGLSVWHLNRPIQSLMNNEEVRLSVKYIFHCESEINFNIRYHLLPALFFQLQGTYTEILVGSRFKYISSDKINDYSAFLGGIFYRNKDAVILYSGYQYKLFQFGISYDFNISTLKTASNYLGGIEINISWHLPANRTPKQKDLPCPIF